MFKLFLGVGGISSLSHNPEPVEDLEFKDNGYGADQDDSNANPEYNYGGIIYKYFLNNISY